MVKKILIGLAVLGIVLAILPFFGSSDWNVTSKITIQAAPAQIYPDVAVPQKWLDWSVWNGSMEITRGSPAEGIEYTLALTGSDTPPIKGSIKFTKVGGATEVEWGSAGNGGDSWGFKAMNFYGIHESRMMADYNQSLATLKARAEDRAAKKGTPVEASAEKK